MAPPIQGGPWSVEPYKWADRQRELSAAAAVSDILKSSYSQEGHFEESTGAADERQFEDGHWKQTLALEKLREDKYPKCN